MSEVTILDPGVVKAEVVEYVGSVVEDARVLSLSISDDESCARAVDLGQKVKDKMKWLTGRREAVYEPLKKATESVRLEYDTPLKLGDQIQKTLAAAVITYKQKKRAEEERIRLAAEAEERRLKEEAARKEREAAAERDRIIRERELEESRKRQAIIDEENRKKAEEERVRKEAEVKAKAEADERARQLKEEEDRRIANAQEAHDQGLGDRSEQILDTQKPVAPIAAPLPSAAETAAKAESERVERERIAEEARRKEEERIAEQKKRDEEVERLRKLDEDAAIARAAAEQAGAVAAQSVTVTRPEDKMRTSVSWKYDVPNIEAYKKLCLAIAQGRAPVEYGGFDPENPQKFRAAAIQKDVTRMKGEFQGEGIGIRTWPEESGSFKAGV
jgi:hypothetical protein